MKTKLSLILLMLITGSFALHAKNLQARFAYATFNVPGKSPFIETYLNVNGHSVFYRPTPAGTYQASIEVSMVFLQENKIKFFDKYNLMSPEAKDTVSDLSHFTDQHRISLPNGTYELELSIRDRNHADAKPYQLKQEVVINYESNVVAVSDIELINSYQKTEKENALSRNGYDLVPMVDNFFPENINALKFYAEVYNTSAVIGDGGYLLSYHIESAEQHLPIEDFSKNIRETGKPVEIILAELDITNLPSGNYNLVIDVRNRDNDLLASKSVFLQRSKGAPVASAESVLDPASVNITNTFVTRISSRDSMAEYIRCLWPISNPNENTWAMNQLELADLKIMQQYFYAFWQRRSAATPEQAWLDYKQKVDLVNSKFRAGRKKGYLTERGRVYLQYGPPNQVSENYSEPNSYPYEIWQYYKMKEQTNRKFVFYNPEFATNDFRLLHSDAKGEINEPQWQIILRKRTESMSDIDRTLPQQQNNTQVNQVFTNPR